MSRLYCGPCRHVLEYMVKKQPAAQNQPDASPRSHPPTTNQLATSHENVTILFTE